MSQLWDTSGIAPQKNIVMAGETIPAIFWNAVTARGPHVWMRQKDFGIWRSWTWNETAQAVREIGHGLMALGFEARHTSSLLSNNNIEWVLGRSLLNTSPVQPNKRWITWVEGGTEN